MIILPAIDLMNGEVVRLEQGQANRKTVYSADPAAFAQRWVADGATWLHLVDLDAAFSGEQRNLAHVKNICATVSVPCELGGGLRDMAALSAAFAAGVRRAIIGSRACESLDFIKEAVREFGGDRIAVGIDAKDGKVATQGWVKISAWDALDLAKAVADLGAGNIIYTDIGTDGMFTGPNLPAQRAMLAATKAKLTASGGVASLADLRALGELDGLYGVIVGKALYDKKVDLREAIEEVGGR
ncbi:MAG: 1-(5-phosphoribosyl)-5-[(5-phosphoribosylamino)methylideneamino]imidazole-4-carboxamide isomerase [Verrucomicrobiales bacterium]|jgi:phosphoribosylformimino-5-aminoimidazole carboxamide ribotide isomerase|nr:1-(5-phosphoribosyl)-5-[(5-phosphoribosylamino)methylideneamino]imidazole-4-carboxamide isomerase [Verrucomicrobiales bacterium]